MMQHAYACKAYWDYGEGMKPSSLPGLQIFKALCLLQLIHGIVTSFCCNLRNQRILDAHIVQKKLNHLASVFWVSVGVKSMGVNIDMVHHKVSQNTSSTAWGGGRSFKNRKPIGEIGCCESRMSEQKHWLTDYLASLLTHELTNWLIDYLTKTKWPTG